MVVVRVAAASVLLFLALSWAVAAAYELVAARKPPGILGKSHKLGCGEGDTCVNVMCQEQSRGGVYGAYLPRSVTIHFPACQYA